MQEARGTWGEVQVLSYIRDKNGKTWRVDRLSSTRARLSDREGNEIDILRPPATREVAMLIPTEEEARFTLAAALGARVLASRDSGGHYECPAPSTWDLDTARWHMERFHRVECEDRTLETLLEMHTKDTGPPVIHKHTEAT